jgi:cytochrome P450
MTYDAGVEDLFRTIEYFLGNQRPGKWMVQTYPQLAKLPKVLQWWRPYGEKLFNDTITTYRSFYKSFQEALDQGIQKDCFPTNFFAVADDFGFSKDQQMFAAGTLIEAGSDTTRYMNHVLIAHAAHDPSWVKIVGARVDRVCGYNAERLPEYADWDKLLLVHATIKETLRIFPSLPRIGTPRALTQDDEYNGYRFKAGTIFLANHWHISTNPNEYFEPRRFNPERFMNEHVKDMLEGHIGFGNGRRVCVGWNVGWRNMFIVFSRLLYCFDFIEDPNNPIDVENVPVLQTHNPPFKVTIKPRSKAHGDLIVRACKYAASPDAEVVLLCLLC